MFLYYFYIGFIQDVFPGSGVKFRPELPTAAAAARAPAQQQPPRHRKRLKKFRESRCFT